MDYPLMGRQGPLACGSQAGAASAGAALAAPSRPVSSWTHLG